MNAASAHTSIREHRVSMAGVLVALGIIYGDIGTSPLYVIKAILGSTPITADFVYGGLSCIFWTLTLQTTLKYVVLTLQADNKGEGGVFSLFALVRRQGNWLFFPAIIGGSALLADGIITPPISVSSAIEGIRNIYPNIPTVPIVLCILLLLFSLQNLGTKVVGWSFGPIMLVWFLMLGTLGMAEVVQHPDILRALNPYYAMHLLVEYPGGFWVLGAVFLCTTGAEALYSDLGHCGKGNIRLSWVLVKTALVLNYAGQSAWTLRHVGQPLGNQNPFYEIMPQWFLVPGIAIATVAAVIASQALISGSFTLVTEASRLYLFPKAKVVYPTEIRGQIYLPGINLALCIGCIGIVLIFQESSNMEAAYGLAITLTMLMTTCLLSVFLFTRGFNKFVIALIVLMHGTIEISFLVANLSKFSHGGWVALVVGAALFAIMFIWNRASMLKRSYTEYVDMREHLPRIRDLGADGSVPKYATHLVYMTGATNPDLVESKVMYSLYRKQPKRADVYWFVHVAVVDEPYTMEYKVTTYVPNQIFRIDFRLGFRVEPRINFLFRIAIDELSLSSEVDVTSRYDSLRKHHIPGDFRFVVLEKTLSYENDLPAYEEFLMRSYFLLRYLSITDEESFGLDTSSVVVESVPLIISPIRKFDLERVE